MQIESGVSMRRRTAANIIRSCILAPLVYSCDVHAFSSIPPDGYLVFVNESDGYSFVYPAKWAMSKTSGNTVCFRNPQNISENLLVEVSSSTSTKITGVENLGAPDKAARKYL